MASAAPVTPGFIQPAEGDGGGVGGPRDGQPFVLQVLGGRVQSPGVVLQEVRARFLGAETQKRSVFCF